MNLFKNILKNIGVIILAIAIFIVGSLSSDLLRRFISNQYLGAIVYCIIKIAVISFLAWIVSAKFLKMDAECLGIKFTVINYRWIVISILLPVLIIIFYSFILPGKPFVAKDGKLLESLIFGFFVAGLSSGITEELIFRGMIFRYMKKTLGTKIAVIVPAILFACLHILNMTNFNLLDLILLILAGSSVSIMFTLFALESNSIWPGALAHSLWNFLIIGNVFGIGGIVNGMKNNSYIVIPIESTSTLLTGGNFGVEAALPAIIGFVLVSVIVYMRIKKSGS